MMTKIRKEIRKTVLTAIKSETKARIFNTYYAFEISKASFEILSKMTTTESTTGSEEYGKVVLTEDNKTRYFVEITPYGRLRLLEKESGLKGMTVKTRSCEIDCNELKKYFSF